jgi:phage shock protein E
MRLLLLSLLLVVATVIFYYLYSLAVYGRWRISALDARQRLSKGKFDIVLDVRTALERETLGYYPGSVHLPSAELDSAMAARFPDKSASILVYCNTGHRARLATDKLHALGYENAVYISSPHWSLQV